MIAYYGYEDGSGEYYICIDSAKCDGCAKCIQQCPQKILEMTTIMIELENEEVAAVKEKFRREIKYVCASCDHKNKTPCVLSCLRGAITTIWTAEK